MQQLKMLSPFSSVVSEHDLYYVFVCPKVDLSDFRVLEFKGTEALSSMMNIDIRLARVSPFSEYNAQFISEVEIIDCKSSLSVYRMG